MNVTLLDVWVILSASGLFLSLILVWESWQDIKALGSASNGRRWSARSRFAREGLRVTVHWTWLLMGASVLLDISLGVLLVLGLLYGNLVLVVNSVIDARTRSLIYRTRAKEPEIRHP